MGEDGEPVPGSIASVERIDLGGAPQWLVIRGHDVTNPVVLFLSGGPGGSELARQRAFLSDLESDATVVIWEQRGAGKSYAAGVPHRDLTLDLFVDDTIELGRYLRDRFERDVSVLGHSWGTIVGTEAVRRLERLGPPPYEGPRLAFTYGPILATEPLEAPFIDSADWHERGDLMGGTFRAPEYTLRDKVNFVRGLYFTFQNVYP